jgi:leucyl-tRNA synthetase
MSLASPDKDSVWNDRGMDSTHKFVTRIYLYLKNVKIGKSSAKIESKLHKTIKEYTQDIENFKYNLGLIKLRALLEDFEKEEELSKETVLSFIKLLHPFCPHMTEELWELYDENKEHGYLSLAKWPIFDESKIDLKAEAVEKYVEDSVADIKSLMTLIKLEKANQIKLIVSPIWKYEVYSIIKESLKETRNPGDILKKIMSTDLKKHGQDITKMVPNLIKDTSKIPETILDQNIEYDALMNKLKLVSEIFNAEIIVEKAELSVDAKAKNASPGKPAILIQ